MILTNDQIIAITTRFDSSCLCDIDLSELTTFEDFDYWWTFAFGITNNLSTFLLNMDNKHDK